ncbi:hypothetical protein DL98DRAFT_593663 [Cadophora sp. DSE1049]|nr:hypothetical protein DL98DRAFT_593663 [Cadophora sp. DSE1049]
MQLHTSGKAPTACSAIIISITINKMDSPIVITDDPDEVQPDNPYHTPRKQGHHMPRGVERERDRDAGVLTIDNRYVIPINERVKKEVEHKLSAAVKEHLEGLLKPIVDLLQTSISSRPAEGDLEKKIVAIVKQQLEALPKSPAAVEDSMPATEGQERHSESSSNHLQNQHIPYPQAEVLLPANKKSSSQRNRQFSSNYAKADDTNDESSGSIKIVSVNKCPRKGYPPPSVEPAKHTIEKKSTSTRPTKKAKTAETESKTSNLNNDQEWAKSWQEIYVGKRLDDNGKLNPQLEASALPAPLTALISLREKTQLGARVRNRNAVMNPNGEPTLCWNSQQFSRSDWLVFHNIPTGTSKVDQEKQRQWWRKEWSDKSKECPQCQYKGSKGEDNVYCFFFFREDTVMLHRGP